MSSVHDSGAHTHRRGRGSSGGIPPRPRADRSTPAAAKPESLRSCCARLIHYCFSRRFIFIELAQADGAGVFACVDSAVPFDDLLKRFLEPKARAPAELGTRLAGIELQK